MTPKPKSQMIKNKDIVVVGLQPWDIKIGSNCKNIAIELSRHNRILYVNAPIDQITRVRQRKEPAMVRRLEILKSGQNILRVADNIWNLYPKRTLQSINWMPDSGLYRALNRRNNRAFATDIREAMTELGFTNSILFNDSD